MKQGDAARKRAEILASLPPLTEILRGSLLHRIIRHKRGCQKCAGGGGHPAYVLTIGYSGGRTRQFTVHRRCRVQISRWLNNYRRLKAKLEAVCELNHAFLQPEK